MEPLVTVVTATYRRPRTIVEHAVASVRRQDYGYIEHLVVMEGPDEPTQEVLEQEGYDSGPSARRFITLGRNWTSYAENGSIGAVARLVGSWSAAGDLITYLDDDNDYDATHISEMVELFEDCGIDFALSPWHGRGLVAPAVGHADTSGIMHRAKTLQRAGGLHPDGATDDGNMVVRWVNAGLNWASKTNPTFHINGYHQGAPEWL